MSDEISKQHSQPLRRTPGAFHSVRPTAREVSLARLLVYLIDSLGVREDMEPALWNDVSQIANITKR